MNPKAKKVLKKIFKIVWILLGCFFALLFIIAIIHAKTLTGSGFSAIGAGIAAGVFIAMTLGLLVIYGIATGLFFLIRWIVRKTRQRKNMKVRKMKNG